MDTLRFHVYSFGISLGLPAQEVQIAVQMFNDPFGNGYAQFQKIKKDITHYVTACKTIDRQLKYPRRGADLSILAAANKQKCRIGTHTLTVKRALTFGKQRPYAGTAQYIVHRIKHSAVTT